MRRHHLLLTALALPLWLSACGGDIQPGRTENSPPTIRSLVLAPVTVEAVAGTQAFVGTIESGDRAVLSARTDGRVGRILVHEGAQVAAGALLLTLEQTTVGARLSEVEGGERAAAARLDLAEKTYARYAQLRASEAVTPQEMDRVTAERDAAREQLKAARAQLDQARTGASYNRVVAPYAGRIVRREVELGTTVMPGAPLLVLDRDGDWHARLNLPEAWLDKVRIGDPMPVEVPALERVIAGTIREILPIADPRSRSFSVKVALAEADGLSAGLFARAARCLDQKQTLLVPAAAVVERGQLTGVYVVADGILHYRLVQTGRTLDNQVEILSGVSVEETVVAEGTARAVNGAKVEP